MAMRARDLHRQRQGRGDSDGEVREFLLAAGLITSDFNPSNPVAPLLKNENYQNKALDTDVYGGRRISYFNKYDRFQQVEKINPRIGVGLVKLGLRLRGKEFKLFVDKSAGLEGEAEQSILQDAGDFTTALDMQNFFTAAGRLLARDGSVPILNSADKRFGNGEGITTLDFMPMSHTTFLPIDVEPMSGVQNEEQLWEYATIIGGVTQVIINERLQAKREIHYMKNGRVTLMRLMHHGHQCRDIYNRNTIGLYGVSLMELVDEQVKKLEDVNWGFSKAIGRYGYGRLHIDNDLMKQRILDDKLTLKQAAKILAAEAKIAKGMKPDEDIISIGKTVQAIPGGFQNASGVIEFKESLERDIAYGLLETEAGSGKAKGTTFASSYIADMDAVRVLEAMRIQLKVGFEKIYQQHLILLGYSEDEAKAIRIELQPIDQPLVELPTLLEVAAQDPSALTVRQALEIVGIHVPPRETVDKEEGQTIQEDQKTPVPVNVEVKPGTAPGQRP